MVDGSKPVFPESGPRDNVDRPTLYTIPVSTRPGTMRIARQMAITAVTMLAGISVEVRSQGGVGVVTGQVIEQLSGKPLGYSVVSIAALDREQFTGADGRFTLPNLAAGRVTIRAKRIGFIPRDVVVEVKAGEAVSTSIAMSRIPVELPAVRAEGELCTNPGAPKNDVALAQLVEQLRQNADAYRLLLQRYPFNYAVQRTFSRRDVDALTMAVDKLDTLIYPSRRDYKYEAGKVLRYVSSERNTYFVFAHLDDFASDAFLDAHCFRYAGETTIDGASLLEIRFVPSSKIKSVDMEGSFFLDPATYQLRRARYSPSTPPPPSGRNVVVPAAPRMSVTTVFVEVVPSVPVIGQVESESGPLRSRNSGRPEYAIELHQLLRVDFLRGRP
jgi:hypothetical protein